MDEDKKKIIMIFIIIICIGSAAGITYWTNYCNFSNVSYTITLLCTNPKCMKKTEYSAEQFRDIIIKMNKEGGLTSAPGPLAFTCPHCNEKSCYIAEKCAKCGTFFVSKYDPVTREHIDKCPQCGYSATEEARRIAGASD